MCEGSSVSIPYREISQASISKQVEMVRGAILDDRPDDFDVYYIPETGAICTLRFVRETLVKMGCSPDFEIPANWERW